MSIQMLRLGGFFSVPGNHLAGWRHPDAIPTYDMDFQGYAHITQVAEAAKFDCIFFQDTVGVLGQPRAGARRAHARQALAHGQARADRDAGGARHGDRAASASWRRRPRPTTSPTTSPAASCRSTISASGRAGWNLVTSQIEDESENFGFDEHLAHAERYERAAEFYEVVTGLWDSWEDGGLLRDKAERRLHGPRQGPFPRPRRQALQGQGTAQHHALAAGLAGDRPGRLVRGRPRARRAHRRRGVHRADQDRRGQGVLRRHQEARGALRPRARGHQDHAGPDAGARPDDGRRARRTTRSCSR